LAKKRKIKKKQMMSQIEVTNQNQPNEENRQESSEEDSQNGSSFSDYLDDDDYIDDFDDSQNLNLLDRDELDKEINDSCIIENDSTRVDYLQIQNQ
jgi:hypothetical protein